MNNNQQQQHTVRVPSDTRAPDWAVRKAKAMHGTLAGACDRSARKRKDRTTARAERKARIAAQAAA